MNKNPEAMKQYLADRTARAGAELRELTGTDTVLLPVTGEPKLYVAVGPLAGIAQVAGKSFDEAAGNTNKAVLTDEQIEQMWETAALHARAGEIKYYFAGLVHAAVLSNAGNVQMAEKVTCDACGGVGGIVMDGDCSDCNGKGYDWEPIDAAPAPADNPSTAGIEGLTRYRPNGIGSMNVEPIDGQGYYLVKDVLEALAAPALNPSDVRVAELEAQLAECSALAQKWAAASGAADGRAHQARDQALEEAAMACKPALIASATAYEIAAIRKCGDAIRALKGATAQSVEGGDRG